MVLLGTEVAAFSESDETMTLIPELTVCLNSCNNPKNSVFISGGFSGSSIYILGQPI